MQMSTATAYIVGGCIVDQVCDSATTCYCLESTTKCSAFHVPSNEWTSCGDMATRRYRHMGALLNDKIYIFGGRSADDDSIILSIAIYDIASVTGDVIPIITVNNITFLSAYNRIPGPLLLYNGQTRPQMGQLLRTATTYTS